MPMLVARLECELPDEVETGAGTAVFVCGWCFSPESPVSSLQFTLGDDVQPVMASRMPRLEPFQALHPGIDPFSAAGVTRDEASGDDPLLHSYRSGFWGIVRLAPELAGHDVALGLRAELEDGTSAATELARIHCTSGYRPRGVAVEWPRESGPRVAICMATYEPPTELLRHQLDSIREQSHRNWLCFISDDHSSADGFKRLEEAVGDDPRFVLSRAPRRLGFYRNFERALSMVPDAADYVALADQDDRWYPDKLESLLAEIGGAQLVYSDARVISGSGEVISDTWWNTRRNNHSSLLSVLVANSITGAASLMRRELLESILPFPPAQFAHFHDHWIGLVALALGDVEFIERPLYDYVQHRQASLGHAAANQMVPLLARLANQRALADRVRLWRLNYFVDVCRIMQFATILKQRCWARMSRRRRAELSLLLASDRSLPALAYLGFRGARELIGARRETLGAEWMLFFALSWRRLVELSARERPQRRFRMDALPPPTLVMPPGRVGVDPTAQSIADKISPLRWVVVDDAPARINLLIPSIDLKHFFGGYITKMNLARRLAERGAKVRVVTVDPQPPLPPAWREELETYRGLQGVTDTVEVVFGRESSGIDVSARDGFIATTWWTAHIARDALGVTGGRAFVYLIQEYEPFTFPMGTYASLAAQSYEFPHFALFSSELLREYFRNHELGVYAADASGGDRSSVSFENAITPVVRPTIEELDRAGPGRLLFYARPEPHAARNMFELGVLALARALEEGLFAGWELHGIGTVQRGRRIELGSGAALELLPRADQDAYGRVLKQHDVGLALMYTPHPSLVPIEMAAAGMLTVTNTFENKTAAAMRAISSNLLAAPPSIEGIVRGLSEAHDAAADYVQRVRGSAVGWSRDWDECFTDDLVDRVIEALVASEVAVA